MHKSTLIALVGVTALYFIYQFNFYSGTDMRKNKIMPRGIRNNNPGNIEQGINWNGLDKNGTDDRFCTFTSAEYGIRAIFRILRTYRNKYQGLDGVGNTGYDTIYEIISRWAPPSENNTEAYIDSVSAQTGIDPRKPLDMSDYEAVISAIIYHENGVQPYSIETIKAGIALA